MQVCEVCEVWEVGLKWEYIPQLPQTEESHLMPTRLPSLGS